MVGEPTAIAVFKGAAPASRTAGERLRLIAVRGALRGQCFCLSGDNVVVGRDASADIRIEDTKVSRKHAEIRWRGQFYEVVDLGSSNGILVNKAKVMSAPLKPGDYLAVGVNIFEVLAAGAVPKPKSGVSADPASIEEQKKVQRSRMLVGIGLMLLLMFAFSANEDGVQTLRERALLPPTEDEAVTKPKKRFKDKELEKVLKDFMPMSIGAGTPQRKQAEVFYRQGMREVRYKNYRRAMGAFETALTIDPTFETARVHQRVAKVEFEREIDLLYRRAVEDRKALRYKSSCLNLKDVLNALVADQKNEVYKKADEDLKKLTADGYCNND